MPALSAFFKKAFRPRNAIIFLIVALIVGFCTWRVLSTSKHKNHDSAHRSAVPFVRDAIAQRADFPIHYTLLGTVVPVTNVTVTPRVNGHILNVYYQEGDLVRQGDLLELIDPRPYEAALMQAKGTLAADQAQLDKARVDNKRYQKLLTQQSTSAMLARDQEFTVRQLEGQVALDKGSVRNAELNLEYCRITAPVAGRVGIRALDKGNYVTAGQSGGLTTLAQMEPISVIFTLPQNDLPTVYKALREKGALPIEAWDGGDAHLLATGTVKALDSQIDTSTGTVRLRGIFANKDHALFPNQFVNIRLTASVLPNAITVPIGAVQTGPQGPYVYTLTPKPDDKEIYVAHLTPVELGPSNASSYVVLKGLEPGAPVVTDGIDRVHKDADVKIVKP